MPSLYNSVYSVAASLIVLPEPPERDGEEPKKESDKQLIDEPESIVAVCSEMCKDVGDFQAHDQDCQAVVLAQRHTVPALRPPPRRTPQ